MPEKNRGVTFIIPALNEESVIYKTVMDVHHVVRECLDDFEIILINDGSTDRTGALMDELAQRLPRVRVLHNPRNMGLGRAYRRGLEEAQKPYLMLLCGDGGFPASSLPPVLEKIGAADIVIPRMTNLREVKTPLRYLISRIYTNLLNIIFSLNIGYYNGLPLHRVDLLRRIDITSDGFGFQAEILIKLIRAGCTYVEVDVLGAEQTRRSKALRLRNIISVANTLVHLIVELATYKAPSFAETGVSPAADAVAAVQPGGAQRRSS